MKLIYKCKLCGQIFEVYTKFNDNREIFKHGEILLSNIYSRTTHECIENKQYGVGELIGAKY